MTIDILSMIIGAILWELVTAYFRRVIKPAFERIAAKNTKKKNAETKAKEAPYQEASVGFNAELKTKVES